MQYSLLLNELDKNRFWHETEARLESFRRLLRPSMVVARPLPWLLPLCAKAEAPFCMITPDLGRFARDLREGGAARALAGRFLSMGAMGRLRAAWRLAALSPQLASKDFYAGVRLLVELEWGEVQSWSPHALCLTGEIADISFLLDNPRAVRYFEEFAGRQNKKWGLITSNFCMAASRLTSWRVHPDFVLAPFHPEGYGMRPSREACEEAQRRNSLAVMGYFPGTADQAREAQVQRYFSDLGIKEITLPFDALH